MLSISSYLPLNDGQRIPLLGFGVFLMKGDETAQAVSCALKCGYRHIDTAAIYGNEAEVAAGIKDSGVPRDEIFITSKLWNDDTKSGEVRRALETSLKKLDTDYLNLYLVHWPVPGFAKAYAEMARLHQEGLIKSIGVSNFPTEFVDELKKECEVIPAVNQVECHPHLNQRVLLDDMRRRGIALEAYSPLGGEKSNGALRNHPKLIEIAKKHGKSPVQVLIRWQLQRSVIVLPKASKPEHIKSNAEIFNFVLDDTDLLNIGSLNQDLRYNGSPTKFMTVV
ncbi:MAG: aldo/keto reductase [Proteobacteria bacterium]|uniref:Aldo/keto reductase n=1 Tax=Candidatus Avisuccinivibrio stercorigallinarum TaxID=2840704 RepID=A0A9D9GTF3_9GAMM|nr:aldo/keto reductase [Candidatus Avisuccinivibrio stercorigallinarum]